MQKWEKQYSHLTVGDSGDRICELAPVLSDRLRMDVNTDNGQVTAKELDSKDEYLKK